MNQEVWVDSISVFFSGTGTSVSRLSEARGAVGAKQSDTAQWLQRGMIQRGDRSAVIAARWLQCGVKQRGGCSVE